LHPKKITIRLSVGTDELYTKKRGQNRIIAAGICISLAGRIK
jgi:hypothetical protein